MIPLLLFLILLPMGARAAECDAEPLGQTALPAQVKASFEKFSRIESMEKLESTWRTLSKRSCRRTESGGHRWVSCMRVFCREEAQQDSLQFRASINERGDTVLRYGFVGRQVGKKDVSALLATLPAFDINETRIAVTGDPAKQLEEIKVNFPGGWYLARSSSEGLSHLERRERKPQSPPEAWPLFLTIGEKAHVALPFPIGPLNVSQAGVVDFVRSQKPNVRPALILTGRGAGTAEIKIQDGQGRERELLLVTVRGGAPPPERSMASQPATAAAPAPDAIASPAASPCAKGRQIIKGVALFPELFFERTSAMLEAIDGSDPEQEYPLPGTRGDPKRRGFDFQNFVHDQTKLFLRVYIGEKAYDSEAIYLDRTKGCTITQTIDQRKWLLKLPRP